MKIKIIKEYDNRLEFNIRGIDVAMANALRRALISRIPMMAIEEVTFYDNSSALNDEVLAHRLGLIPLKTDFAGPETIELSLESDGPGTVYSGEIKVKEMKIKGKSIKLESIAVYDNIPITKLTEKQSVKLEAKAKIGTGKEHMKWQGGLASYNVREDGSIDFFVESFGQLDVQKMIEKSFEVVQHEIKELKSTLR